MIDKIIFAQHLETLLPRLELESPSQEHQKRSVLLEISTDKLKKMVLK